MSREQLRELGRVIVVQHNTRCVLCGRSIERGDGAVWLPPSVPQLIWAPGTTKSRCLHLDDQRCGTADRRACD